MNLWKILLVVLTLITVFFRVICVATDEKLTRVDGISIIFLKVRKLRAGDHWKNPPLSAKKAADNCSRYDAVWCAQLIAIHNRRGWDLLRSNNPNQVLLRYTSGDSAKLGNLTEYLDYDYINSNHPEWFLLEDGSSKLESDFRNPDKRIRARTDPKHHYYNVFYLDIGNKGFQQWAADYLVSLAKGELEKLKYSYDGIGMDNVRLTQLEKVLTKRYPNWKYAGKGKEYNQAYLDYLSVVHKALKNNGLILVVNQTLDYGSDKEEGDWQRLFECVDGVMDEGTLRSSETSYWHGQRWLNSIERHEEVIRRGLIDWWLAYPRVKKDGELTKADRAYEDFLYTYCSWLLVKEKGKSFYHSSKGVMGYKNPNIPWYDEYDLSIGKPVGSRYRMGQCWARDYQGAKIVVNPTRKMQVVKMESSGKVHLNWITGELTNEVTIPAQSGVIMLPTVYENPKLLNPKP